MAVDVSWNGYLYVDDLVRDREHSLSPTRMENTFQEYLNKMVDRKSGYCGSVKGWKGLNLTIEDVDEPQDEFERVLGKRVTVFYTKNRFAGAKELMVGTLWNVLDPLERMKNKYEGDPLYLFRRIPALDDRDESNFDYEINGFTTEYYRGIRERLDSAEWSAKYQQEPFVREGLLFPKNELRFFNGILPDGDYKTVAVVDIAWGGGDSLSMPIGKQNIETGDVYIVDWVFNNGAKEVTIPLVVGQIINNEIRKVRFEGNQGGELYRDYVDKELIKHKYRCSTEDVKAPNKVSKVEKIIAYSGDIKRKFVFLDSRSPSAKELEVDAELGIKRYRRSSEYEKAMQELHSFVTIGKNEHDDAPDGLTQLQMLIDGFGQSRVVTIMESPF